MSLNAGGWQRLWRSHAVCSSFYKIQIYSKDLAQLPVQPSGNIKIEPWNYVLLPCLVFCFTSFPIPRVLLYSRSVICRKKFYSWLLNLHYHSTLASPDSILSRVILFVMCGYISVSLQRESCMQSCVWDLKIESVFHNSPGTRWICFPI